MGSKCTVFVGTKEQRFIECERGVSSCFVRRWGCGEAAGGRMPVVTVRSGAKRNGAASNLRRRRKCGFAALRMGSLRVGAGVYV